MPRRNRLSCIAAARCKTLILPPSGAGGGGRKRAIICDVPQWLARHHSFFSWIVIIREVSKPTYVQSDTMVAGTQIGEVIAAKRPTVVTPHQSTPNTASLPEMLVGIERRALVTTSAIDANTLVYGSSIVAGILFQSRQPAPTSRHCFASQGVQLRGLSLRSITAGVVESSEAHLRILDGQSRVEALARSFGDFCNFFFSPFSFKDKEFRVCKYESSL
jgi:hypothetical protein